MRGLVMACLAACLTMSAAAQTRSTEVRFALVIGISDYNGDGDTLDNDPNAAATQGFVTDLRNPGNDASDLATALRRLNFHVDTAINPNRDQLIDALIGFGQRIEAARAAGSSVTTFVFYAGHGMQVEGVNYIIPSQARLPQQNLAAMPARQAQTLLETRAISFATLVNQLPADPGYGVNVIVLDACRNNPWERRVRAAVRGPNERGLADERFDHRRTLIAFSAQPGMVAADGDGRNSPFTEALLAHVGRTNVSVKDMFDEVGSAVEARHRQQIPWTNAPSLSRYCLAGCSTAVGVSTANAESDRTLWEAIQRNPTIPSLRDYLRRAERGDLPGTFAQLARDQLLTRERNATAAYDEARSSPSSHGYRQFISRYPDSDQLPDAQSRLASCSIRTVTSYRTQGDEITWRRRADIRFDDQETCVQNARDACVQQTGHSRDQVSASRGDTQFVSNAGYERGIRGMERQINCRTTCRTTVPFEEQREVCD